MNMMLSPPKISLSPDALYEIVDGEKVEVEPMSFYAGQVASNIYGELFIWKRANPRIGSAAIETLFRMPVSDRTRRPDLAFISQERYPVADGMEIEGECPAPPELAVEVLSPHDKCYELEEKIEEYFENDVKEVWVVLPEQRKIKVYKDAYSDRALHGSELLASDLLPGFQVAVDTLFPKVRVKS